MDITSLRIDNQERMANQLNDFEISPTNYMIAFLRQRGWTLPAATLTIPNVIPEVKPDAAAVSLKRKLGRLCCFVGLRVCACAVCVQGGMHHFKLAAAYRWRLLQQRVLDVAAAGSIL